MVNGFREARLAFALATSRSSVVAECPPASPSMLVHTHAPRFRASNMSISSLLWMPLGFAAEPYRLGEPRTVKAGAIGSEAL